MLTNIPQLGVMFPQNEIGGSVDNLDHFIDAAIAGGCRHIWATDHVVGVDTSRRPDWAGPYTVDSEFHEPLMLFAYLAARCELELFTGVIILPQRQTVLVAKQAAELDLLCRGRLRLGVGVGWNPVEYQALGMDFSTRGRRIEEQITLLRQLWSQRVVDFCGEFDQVDGAGIAPLPVQRPIPVWMGAGDSPAGLRRIGRLADGYLAQAVATGDGQVERHLAQVRQGAELAGRDFSGLGIQGLVPVVGKSDGEILDIAGRWRDLGASHLSIDPRAVSLHVNQDLSMEEKLARQRSSLSLLVDNLQRATALLARL